MDLQKTTIIPTDDAGPAKSMLNDIINEQAVVLFMVIGNDQWAKNLVQMADKVARTRPEIRRVAWIRLLQPVNDVVKSLIKNSNIGSEIVSDSSFALVLSMADKVCDVINKTEPQLDFVRINDAFLKAEVG